MDEIGRVPTRVEDLVEVLEKGMNKHHEAYHGNVADSTHSQRSVMDEDVGRSDIQGGSSAFSSPEHSSVSSPAVAIGGNAQRSGVDSAQQRFKLDLDQLRKGSHDESASAGSGKDPYDFVGNAKEITAILNRTHKMHVSAPPRSSSSPHTHHHHHQDKQPEHHLGMCPLRLLLFVASNNLSTCLPSSLMIMLTNILTCYLLLLALSIHILHILTTPPYLLHRYLYTCSYLERD